MAAGDGMADIVGRRFGTIKWPFSATKSIAGSLGFILGAFLATSALLSIYAATGCIDFDFSMQWSSVLLVSFICAAVELVPIGDDNITVSLAAFIASYLIFLK
jgi:dolichol kinase